MRKERGRTRQLALLPLVALSPSGAIGDKLYRSYFGGPFEHEPPTYFVPYLWSQRRFSIFVTPWGNVKLPPVYIWHM